MFTSDKFVTGQAVDMKDVISLVTPQITPFSTLLMARNVPAESATISWIEEVLNEAAAVSLAEGGDAPSAVDDASTLMSNYCELVAATAFVSNTAQATNAKGISDLLAREVMKKSQAIKMRLEDKFINGVKAYGSAKYEMNGILNLIATANKVTNATFTVAKFEETISKLYSVGANYNMVCFIPAALKVALNGSTSVQFMAQDKELGFDAEIYNTVYGPVRFVLSEKVGANKLFVVNTDMIELATLIPFTGTLQPQSGSKQSVYLETQVGVKLLNSKGAASLVIA